ncbi:MAG: hypothetical protein CMP39_04000 [Rickettsiales bacterium]|nr:hypothetical protein [Rickettsiales bacterium]
MKKNTQNLNLDALKQQNEGLSDFQLKNDLLQKNSDKQHELSQYNEIKREFKTLIYTLFPPKKTTIKLEKKTNENSFFYKATFTKDRLLYAEFNGQDLKYEYSFVNNHLKINGHVSEFKDVSSFLKKMHSVVTDIANQSCQLEVF